MTVSKLKMIKMYFLWFSGAAEWFFWSELVLLVYLVSWWLVWGWMIYIGTNCIYDRLVRR